MLSSLLGSAPKPVSYCLLLGAYFAVSSISETLRLSFEVLPPHGCSPRTNPAHFGLQSQTEDLSVFCFTRGFLSFSVHATAVECFTPHPFFFAFNQTNADIVWSRLRRWRKTSFSLPSCVKDVLVLKEMARESSPIWVYVMRSSTSGSCFGTASPECLLGEEFRMSHL